MIFERSESGEELSVGCKVIEITFAALVRKFGVGATSIVRSSERMHSINSTCIITVETNFAKRHCYESLVYTAIYGSNTIIVGASSQCCNILIVCYANFKQSGWM